MVVEVQRRDGHGEGPPESRGPAARAAAPGRSPAARDAARAPFRLDYTTWCHSWLRRSAPSSLCSIPTPHDLRHTFGSWLSDRGVPLMEIMVTMGHSSLRATERYMHAGPAGWAERWPP